MKFAYTTLLILVTLLFVSGCSGDNSDDYKNINVVRKVIEKPVNKTEPPEKPRKKTNTIAKKDPDQIVNREKEKAIPIREAKKEEIVPVKETVKEEIIPSEEENIYITKEGDTLSDISGKTEVYGNPLKWTILYRDNSEVLSSIKEKKNLYERNLPAGIRLKLMPEEEISKNLERRSDNYYVSNILSSPYMDEIAPHIVKLIDEGYFAYLSSTVINGKQWYRLRVGFYTTRSKANREGEKIKKHLNIKDDIWTAKIGNEEFHNFVGY